MANGPGPRLSRSLRPLELALVTVLSLLLLVTAIRAISPVFEVAEREAMRGSLAEMRRGLMLAAVVHLARRDYSALAALEAANPAESSPVRLARYAGEHEDRAGLDVPGGYWYFDPGHRVLGYRVAATGAFEGGAADPPRARFRVRLRYRDSDGDGRFTPAVDTFTGIELDTLEAWRWR